MSENRTGEKNRTGEITLRYTVNAEATGKGVRPVTVGCQRSSEVNPSRIAYFVNSAMLLTLILVMI